MSAAKFRQRYHPSRAIVYIILSTSHAMIKGGHALLVEYCSGWRGLKCKELSTAVGIPIFWQFVTQPRGHGIVCRDSFPSSSKHFFRLTLKTCTCSELLSKMGACRLFLVLVIRPIVHANLMKNCTVPNTNSDSTNSLALITHFAHTTQIMFAYPIPLQLVRLWPHPIA